MRIIGLSGKRGVGKSTLANIFVRKFGYEKVSFAAPLKYLARQMFAFTEEDISDIKKKESPWKGHDWTPREFMINLGEFMRYHEKNYWLNKGLAQCTDLKGRYVFDDVRYTNEADALRKIGATMVRINRYEKQNPYGKNLDVESETQLDTYCFDYTIHEFQNTTQLELSKQADIIEDLKE